MTRWFRLPKSAKKAETVYVLYDDRRFFCLGIWVGLKRQES